jgi:NAD(P)-dependent dehydrogenase (short-subunit alcohol dehydrogenase family)
VTVNVDYRSNAAAHVNVDAADFSWEALEKVMAVGSRVVLVANAAGGWTGGTIEDPQLSTKCTQMWRMNVESSVLGGQIAARYFAAAGPGLCVFVGAKGVAMHETPDMLAYAMAKQAVASLATNLACTPRSGLPEGASVVLLLP